MYEDVIIGIVIGIIISVFVTELILLTILVVRLIKRRKVLPEKTVTGVKTLSGDTSPSPVTETQEEEPSLLSFVFDKNFRGGCK